MFEPKIHLPNSLCSRSKRAIFDFSFIERANWGNGCFIEDYLLLIGVIANLKPKTILEIGTNKGLGAVILAYASSLYHPNAMVTTIDINQEFGNSNLHLVPGIDKHIEFIEGNSNDILPQFVQVMRRFDLVFIDGGHGYAQAYQDWRNTQNLTNFWILHDTTAFTGLQRLVEEIRKTHLYDIYQFISAPGHRIRRDIVLEQFITGTTLVHHRSNLDILKHQAHRDDNDNLLPGHGRWKVPDLPTIF